MADAGSSASAAARRGTSASSSTSSAGGRGCAPALGRLVRKLRRQSRFLCAARHGGAASSSASSAARCCRQYDPLSYSRNFDFGSALDGDDQLACSFASRFVLAAAPVAARQPQ